MNNVEHFEIEWRRLLIKKLQPLLTKLNKVADGDLKAAFDRQAGIRELYPTPEDAHEAFGQGWITEDEYRSIAEMLETETVTHATAARDEVKSLMTRYRREIKDFEWEALPEAEKQRIRERQERSRQEHDRRMKSWRENQN